MNSASPITLLVTTGDADGIGLEITLKALKALQLKMSHQILVFASRKSLIPKTLGRYKTILTSKNSMDFKKNHITFLQSDAAPSAWVERAAELCLSSELGKTALITAPMSKGPDGAGHTEILKKVVKKPLSMGFIGTHFNVCLATTHIPLQNVQAALTDEIIQRSVQHLLILKKLSGAQGRLRLLGLNPHAGEQGAISQFDRELLQSVRRLAQVDLPEVLESPDAAFTSIKKGDTFLAWYHDQGLIPFKMKHGFRHGIQVTLGLPFIRTSVDHGTAKDLFGQNKADPSSMILAIKQAARLSLRFGHTQD